MGPIWVAVRPTVFKADGPAFDIAKVEKVLRKMLKEGEAEAESADSTPTRRAEDGCAWTESGQATTALPTARIEIAPFHRSPKNLRLRRIGSNPYDRITSRRNGPNGSFAPRPSMVGFRSDASVS